MSADQADAEDAAKLSDDLMALAASARTPAVREMYLRWVEELEVLIEPKSDRRS